MPDTFSGHSSGLDSPASQAFAISPNDSADLASVTRGIAVGGAGTLVCILAGDTVAVTFTNLAAGTVLPLRVKRVMATGTTATSLVGLL